ncbi:MAG: diguanylate cyclase [Phycisphaerae bacterium]|jgi:diguanylate cyclase (GGDEF)-like protein
MSTKILLVDDSADALAIAEAFLAPEGHQVICTSSGQEVLALAAVHMPDLILMDVDMPDLSGLEVCRALKADPKLNLIPVMFLSGLAGPEDKARGLDAGAMDYVAKPLNPYELPARVRAALRTKRQQDVLIQQARIDPLTVLPTRLLALERLNEEWARLQRHGGQLALIILDLDHFKNLNETHGQVMGDRFLQAVGGVLRRQCRKIDLPARYGDDEFSILLPNESAEHAAILAERCRQEIGQVRIAVPAGVVTVTASFGVADAGSVASSQALIALSDQCLAEAKRLGRNRTWCSATNSQADPRL